MKWFSMFLTQQWLRHDDGNGVWFVVGGFFSGVCMGSTGLLFPYVDLVYLIFQLSFSLYMCMFLHKAGDRIDNCGADSME